MSPKSLILDRLVEIKQQNAKFWFGTQSTLAFLLVKSIIDQTARLEGYLNDWGHTRAVTILLLQFLQASA
jgi:hypothetical protein